MRSRCIFKSIFKSMQRLR